MSVPAQTIRADLAHVRALAGELEKADLAAAQVRVRLYGVLRNLAAQGLSQSSLGEAAGLSRQRISQIVKGDS
jgi:hypothetical protein